MNKYGMKDDDAYDFNLNLRDEAKKDYDVLKLVRWGIELFLTDKKQGTNFLRTGDGAYCCLGVLCEMNKLPSYVKLEEGKNVHVYEGAMSVPPHNHGIELFGIKNASAQYFYQMNDTYGWTFKQIAIRGIFPLAYRVAKRKIWTWLSATDMKVA